MLGRDHALLAAVAAVGLGEPLAHLAHTPLPPVQLAAAGVIVSAFGLLPDIDEPGSTVSRKLGPASRAVAKVTKVLAGGHRQATHSVVFAATVAAAVWWLDRFTLTAPVIVFASLALTITMLVPGGLARKGSAVALIVPLAAGWAAWRVETGSWLAPAVSTHPQRWVWLPVAAGAGVILHMVGDTLTSMGVPWMWPWRKHLAFPLLGHTDSLREQLLASSLSLALVVLAWFDVAAPLIGRGAW